MSSETDGSAKNGNLLAGFIIAILINGFIYWLTMEAPNLDLNSNHKNMINILPWVINGLFLLVSMLILPRFALGYLLGIALMIAAPFLAAIFVVAGCMLIGAFGWTGILIVVAAIGLFILVSIVILRPVKEKGSFRKKLHLNQPKKYWIIPTAISFFIGCFWIAAALVDRDMIEILKIQKETFLSWVFSPLSIVMFFASLAVLWLVLAEIHKHRTWMSIIPLILFLCMFIAVAFMPTKANRLYQKEIVSLERIVTQAKNTQGARGKFTIELGEEIEGQWLRYSDRQRDTVILCVKFDVGNHMDLYYSSSTILEDCAVNPYNAREWSGYWTWSHRLETHWFETSNSPLFWFLQPAQGLSNVAPF